MCRLLQVVFRVPNLLKHQNNRVLSKRSGLAKLKKNILMNSK